MLRNGTPAPDFRLNDPNGHPWSLSDLSDGKPLLLFFFRFEGCPTSRRDVAGYTEVYSRIEEVGGSIAAISADTEENHAVLQERLEVPFPLLSDPGLRVSEQYGVYRSDDVGEGPEPHGEPAVFIVDVDGKIAYSQVQTGPKGSALPAAMVLVLLYMVANGGRY